MPTLTPGDGQDLLDRFKRAWERLRRRRRGGPLSARTPSTGRIPFEAPLAGANEIRAYWNDAAAAQTHVEFDAERVWVSGPTVLASWHAAFTRRATAERVRQRGFMTFELDDAGLVARLRQWSIGRTVGQDRTYRPEGG